MNSQRGTYLHLKSSTIWPSLAARHSQLARNSKKASYQVFHIPIITSSNWRMRMEKMSKPSTWPFILLSCVQDCVFCNIGCMLYAASIVIHFLDFIALLSFIFNLLGGYGVPSYVFVSIVMVRWWWWQWWG